MFGYKHKSGGWLAGALLLAAGGLGAWAGGAAAPSGLDALRRQVTVLYRYVIDGNREDLKRNRTRAELYQRRAQEQESRTGAPAAALRQTSLQLAYLYTQAARNNQAILDAFDKGSTRDLAEPMRNILFLESEIERLGGDRVEREWLTVQEVQDYMQRGWVYSRGREGELPHLKRMWRPPDKK